MQFGRLGLVGLLIVLVGGAAGCTEAADAEPEEQPTDVAVRSYRAATGTPDFCARLADSTHLTEIPAAIGVLAGEHGDVDAELDLTAAMDELRAVLGELQDDGGSLRLEAAIEHLVGALTAARDESLTTSVRDDLSSALDDVGRLVQPVCRFPT